MLLSRGHSFAKYRAVTSAFGQHFSKTKLLPPELHTRLADAFDRRQVSDYQFQEPVTEADGLDLQGKAADFLAQTEA